jgi:hypothetical protein
MTHLDTYDETIDDDDPATIAEDARRFPPGHLVHKALRRTLSDIYSFWCLCDKAACRRAGRCKGEPRDCLDAMMPLISAPVCEGGQRMVEAKCDGLTFDEALARWPDELASLWAWNNRIENRLGAPRPRRDPACGDDA